MSRRKQAKPQHLSSDEDSLHTDAVSENAVLEAMDEEEGRGRQSRRGSKETHVCKKCCAEFFTWAQLGEHQPGCTNDPLVLIVKEDDGIPRPDVSPAGASPAPSFTLSDPADMESTDGGFELGGPVNDNDSSDVLEEREDESMDLEQQPQDKHQHQASTLPTPDSTESLSPQMSTVASYSMPTTNVTLEILQSTRVAVAQFSQGIHNGRVGGKAATAAIPIILEHLLALQQQQVHQLQLIEQIHSQVAVMNKQPTQMALNPVSRALSLAPNPFPSQSLITTSVLPLSGTMPSVINGQASVSLASMLERSQTLSSQTISGHSGVRDVSSTSTFSELPAAPPFSRGDVSTTLPSYSSTRSSLSSAPTPSSSGPLAPGQSSLLGTSGLPFLPQSPPSSVIFPNPLASIAATANALDPLATLMKHRKGKPPNVSVFDTKPSPEEPFFKHKCRFCAKVFGSDSALQIHLRSHTGERPFKCNICGNRFSTKGNLKVHFQRHKEKYPHVQMNPYPVPEYLDNVPTSSGIPYGMSFPPEKEGATWLDSKPVLATMPTSKGLQPPSTLSNDFVSVTPSIKSPYRPASSECASLSPKSTNTELNVPPAPESPQPKVEVDFYKVTQAEEVHLPQNCTNRPRGSPVIAAANTPAATAATTPQPSAPTSPASPFSVTSDQFKARFPFGGPLDSMQTSETSKLQQLVENIDKKITDPNQCVLCHRVLSCQSALKMHYRIHTGERPFKCKVCGRAFTTKGNLKTHFGVHRANPPLRVQHSCPICQKRFTNAVVLQQHIRMHMGGHIPNSPVIEGLQDMDPADLSLDEKNVDSLSSHEHDFMDDNSMEDDYDDDDDYGEEEEETENIEDGIGPFKPLSSLASSPPTSSAVVSSIAALENQMKMIDSTVSLNHSFGIKSLMNGFTDSDRFPFNCTSSKAGSSENHQTASPAASESSCSMRVPASPAQSSNEGHSRLLCRSPEVNHRAEFQDISASVKSEQADSPIQDLRGTQPNKPSVKEENPYSMMFLSRECGPHQSMPSLVSSTVPSPVKTELNGHNRPAGRSEGHHHHHHHQQQQQVYSLQAPASRVSVGSPGLTSLLAPVPTPPRRTPKQHNCNACGKNFSSASALQIHERTHTGEKPFGCSICGRAFTTKGNLKVHMGTHMWNNAPARRGRRLSVENPMALLGGEAMKFGEMFQKDLTARAMNVDAGFWNRYAAAITNGLAMKNNEISVIQNGGIAQLHAMTAGMERVHTGGSPPMTGLAKTPMDLGVNRHFSMLIDDSKEIGIN